MKDVTTDALHYALSVLSDESHAAVVFMLGDRFGVRINGFAVITRDEIKIGLEDLFGSAADILVRRMDEYLQQHFVAAEMVIAKSA